MSSLVSLVIHAVVLVVLGLAWYVEPSLHHEPTSFTLTLPEEIDLSDDDGAIAVLAPGGGPTAVQPGHLVHVAEPVRITDSWDESETPRQEKTHVDLLAQPLGDWQAPSMSARGGGLEGRTAGRKGKLLHDRGGSPATESAVRRGLEWLAAHQRSDGSWWFNHHDGPCQGQCRNPGDFASTTASTALALLSFYGAGETHRQGDYKDVVNRGLYYLGTQMVVSPHGGDLQRGSMYGQGLAAIVLCEAYAMTGDENLKEFAQAALNFIMHAQHVEGGWRYLPGQPGDMTVTGWQLMAWKSGKMARLAVDDETIYRVTHFLDSLESDEGARYGYQNREVRATTTAIGLYCRMLTGWHREYPPMMRGVAHLDAQGPSAKDMYFNYYATQVMNHFDGPRWRRWNEKMTQQLIRDQATEGHEAGSWYYDHLHSTSGGRLYNTCMAIMTLEVYYRYMPLYGPAAIDE